MSSTAIVPALRVRARSYAAALVALAVVAAGLTGMWAGGVLSHHDEHGRGALVALRTSAPVGDLSLAVMGFQRLRDAHAGVNSPRLPMSGPAMPSSTMGPIGGSLSSKQEQIAVTVTLRNPSDHVVGYDAGRLLLVHDGREVPLLRRTRSTLGEGRLMPGSQVSGTVYYVIKPGTAPLELRQVGTDTAFAVDQRGAVPQPKLPAGGHAGH